MSVRTGEPAHQSGTFVCVECFSIVRVVKGERLPDCPCGRNEYELRLKMRAEK